MKRRFCVTLLLCAFVLGGFALPTRAADKTLGVAVEKGEYHYIATVFWSGVTEADDIGALQFTVTYPAAQLKALKVERGAVLRSFGISMGPPSRDKNPATFVAVNLSEPVTANGALAVFSLQALPGATGEAAIELSEVKIKTRISDEEISGAFNIQNAGIVFQSAAPDRQPDCQSGAAPHTDFIWEQDPQDEARLLRTCSVCGYSETKAVAYTDAALLPGEDVSLTPAAALPSETKLIAKSISPQIDAATRQDFSRVLKTERFTVKSAYAVSLDWQGGTLDLDGAKTLSLPAPDGVVDGESVTVLIATHDGSFLVLPTLCKDGKIQVTTEVLGNFYLLTGAAPTADDPPGAGDSPTAPLPDPDGPGQTPGDGAPTEGEPSGGENAPAPEQGAHGERGAFAPWIFFAVAGGLLLACAAVTVLFFVQKRRRRQEAKTLTSDESEETETPGEPAGEEPAEGESDGEPRDPTA